MSHRILVSTLPPFEGGVPAKARILCRHLRALGHEVTVAYYATFRYAGQANVPLWRIPTGAKPSLSRGTCFEGTSAVAVGCRFPEFEAPYHLPSGRWKALIIQHDRHIAIGGNPLVALPFAALGVPHFLWCASGVVTDRSDRQARMCWPRRIVDKTVLEPWLLRLEQRVLRAGWPIRGVSTYTLRILGNLGADPGRLGLMPIPVDPALFTPSASVQEGTVGFAGRFEDPRKNLGLLFEAFRRARERRPGLRLVLAGCYPSPSTIASVARLGLAGKVLFAGEIPRDRLPEFYRSLDLFAIPSHQEGFCIAGMEALSCGVPVVSTRCGGPEDFVRDGETGYLVDGAAEMAERLVQLTSDRALRSRLGDNARTLAASAYAPAAFADALAKTWQAVWGDSP